MRNRTLIQIQWATLTEEEEASRRADGLIYPETYLLPAWVEELSFFATTDWIANRFGRDVLDFTIVSYQ
jgi:hypothetical protein